MEEPKRLLFWFRFVGTGSGSFSHSIVRTISPSGKLHTFEYHKERAEKAATEFIAHGLGKELVEVHHRDVCKDGFGLENIADAGKIKPLGSFKSIKCNNGLTLLSDSV
jgi:hypothetical protein